MFFGGRVRLEEFVVENRVPDGKIPTWQSFCPGA